jgi:hypothetical protein
VKNFCKIGESCWANSLDDITNKPPHINHNKLIEPFQRQYKKQYISQCICTPPETYAPKRLHGKIRKNFVREKPRNAVFKGLRDNGLSENSSRSFTKKLPYKRIFVRLSGFFIYARA